MPPPSEVQIRDWLSEVDVGSGAVSHSSPPGSGAVGEGGADSEVASAGEVRADFADFVTLFCRSFDEPFNVGSDGADSGDASAASAVLLSPNEVCELKALFSSIDSNADSVLTAAELHSAFARIGDELSIDECQQMISEVDTGGNNSITLADFLAALSPA
jgi:hypothetical protein